MLPKVKPLQVLSLPLLQRRRSETAALPSTLN